MTLRTDIFDRCTTGGHAGLSAIVGTKVFLNRIPENTAVPMLRYRIVSADNTYSRDRDTTAAQGRIKHRVQFDCYAADEDAVAALADQVVQAWDRYGGTGCPLGKCWLLNRSEAYNVGLNRHRIIVDIQVERQADS